MKGRSRLTLVSGGADQRNEKDSEELPEREPGKLLVEECGHYIEAVKALIRMTREVDVKNFGDSVLNIMRGVRALAISAQKSNEREHKLDVQRHCVDENMNQLTNATVTSLLMWGDPEVVFRSLFDELVTKSDGVLKAEYYGHLLDQVVTKMVRMVMEKREISEMSKELAREVGGILGFEEARADGLQGRIDAAIVETMTRNLALSANSGVRYESSLLRRLILPRLPDLGPAKAPGRRRYRDTEDMINRLISLITE